MAVQVVSSVSGGTGTGTSKSFNFTAVGGTDSMLVVCVSTYGNGPTSVTFNGDSLTEKTSTLSTYNTSSIWYRMSPDAGTYSVSITGMATNTYSVSGAIELSGVDAVTMFEDFESKTVSGTSASMALTPTMGGSCAVDCLAIEAFWSSGLTVGASQTSVYNVKNSTFVYGGMSYETNLAVSDVTMSWTWGGTFGSSGAFSGVLVKAGTISISEYETIAIQESVSRATSVHDQNELENIGISEDFRGLVSVTINVFDSVGVVDQYTIEAGFVRMLVYETIALGEGVEFFIPFYTPSIVDAVDVSEYIFSDRDPKQVPVFDQITVSEVVAGGDTKFKDFDDTITIDDVVQIAPIICAISVYDLMGYSDEISIVRIFTANVYSAIGIDDDWIETTTIRWGRAFPASRPRGSIDLF